MGERVHEPAGEQHVEARDGPPVGGATPLQAELLRLQGAIGNRAVARLGTRLLARQDSGTATSLPSKLVGLKRKLTWDDYGGAVPANTPYLAGTRVRVDRKAGGANLGTGSFERSGSGFRLKDSVVVTIDFQSNVSWKMIDGLADDEAQLLLDHEQGHYDIAALVARDMFIAIMGLKPQTFASEQDGATALSAITNRYDALWTTINNLYDDVSETGHKAFETLSFGGVRKPPDQARWERYLNRARTEERTPAVTAPDGTPYKVELADILRGAGKSV